MFYVLKPPALTRRPPPSARGVAAIKMLDDRLVGGALLEPAHAKDFALVISENGHLKRISLAEFPVQGRGGQGVQVWKTNETTGLVCGFDITPESADVDIYSQKGRRLRLAVKDINQVTRATKGIDLGGALRRRQAVRWRPDRWVDTGFIAFYTGLKPQNNPLTGRGKPRPVLL